MMNRYSAFESEILRCKLNELPTKTAQLKHIFREARGHLLDTPENRKLITETANELENYLGTDKYGNENYAKILPDGSQIWVMVRNGTIQNAGKNLKPRIFDIETRNFS